LNRFAGCSFRCFTSDSFHFIADEETFCITWEQNIRPKTVQDILIQRYDQYSCYGINEDREGRRTAATEASAVAAMPSSAPFGGGKGRGCPARGDGRGSALRCISVTGWSGARLALCFAGCSFRCFTPDSFRFVADEEIFCITWEQQ
jgi:pyruvate-formate lyase-activating enzyme